MTIANTMTIIKTPLNYRNINEYDNCSQDDYGFFYDIEEPYKLEEPPKPTRFIIQRKYQNQTYHIVFHSNQKQDDLCYSRIQYIICFVGLYLTIISMYEIFI